MRFNQAVTLLVALSSITSINAYTPNSRVVARAKTATTAPIKAVAIPLPDVQQQNQQSSELPIQDQWIANLDYEGFGREVTALGKEIQAFGGKEDAEHLNKILQWRDAAAIIGIATMWIIPNPITIAALSTWTYASWTMIAHHTCHGGYNRVDAGKYNSRGFALGSVIQRTKDWLDWMMPEAWNVEHNRLHHYRLNEGSDPDLVQRNLGFLRDSNFPMSIRYAVVGVFMFIWKSFYYAPNTYKELQTATWKQEGKQFPKNFNKEVPATLATLLFPGPEYDALRTVCPPKDVFASVLGPFFVSRFLLLSAPLLFIPGVGPTLYMHAIINLIAAEFVTNLHAFITIVTNHAGEDLYTFKDAVKPKSSSFYVRQIVGSANYRTGGDINDFAHGWLNYQIEHHVWPDMSMRQYQLAAPKLKSICEKYGVPYVQESAFERLRKTVDIMVGKTTMREFPVEYEPASDKAKTVTWKTTNGAIDDE